jgi:mannose-6-phosphate isomerase
MPMNQDSLYPLLLEPALHIKVWGGRRLETKLHKHLPTAEPYGESWELHDTSKVVNGALAGNTLGDLLARYGHDLIGAHNDPAEGFPLLAKLIDASEWLSVQVHPDDAQAARLEGEPRGKTEAWYILSAEPGAQLVVGVQPGTSRQGMMEAIRTNTLESLLVYAEVRAGDVLFIRAGTVHAIGGGILLYEIQQSSDTTYRLYDWGRMGLDGKPRELHIDKGVEVANTTAPARVEHPVQNPVTACEYFTTMLDTIGGDMTLSTQGRVFHALTCIEGQARLSAGESQVKMHIGQSVLVPASVGDYRLSGQGRVLRSFQS